MCVHICAHVHTVDPEQHGFEMHRSTYALIFFNKYCKYIFSYDFLNNSFL